MAHPYLREAIASTALRIGFPGVLLPLIKHQPDVADAD
jgi:preprotein translocase subunit SecB